MTAYYDRDIHAIFLGEDEGISALAARVCGIANEVIEDCHLAPYRLHAEYGAERVTISAQDPQLELSARPC